MFENFLYANLSHLDHWPQSAIVLLILYVLYQLGVVSSVNICVHLNTPRFVAFDPNCKIFAAL